MQKNDTLLCMREDQKDDSLELIYQEIKENLKEQLSSVDQITTRYSFILGFNSVLLVLLLQTYLNSKEMDCFLKIAGLMLLISMVIALIGFFVKSYRKDPAPGILYDKYKNKSVIEIKKQLSSNYIECFNENKKRIKTLVSLYQASSIITTIAVFIIFIYFIKEGIIEWTKEIINLLM